MVSLLATEYSDSKNYEQNKARAEEIIDSRFCSSRYESQPLIVYLLLSSSPVVSISSFSPSLLLSISLSITLSNSMKYSTTNRTETNYTNSSTYSRTRRDSMSLTYASENQQPTEYIPSPAAKYQKSSARKPVRTKSHNTMTTIHSITRDVRKLHCMSAIPRTPRPVSSSSLRGALSRATNEAEQKPRPISRPSPRPSPSPKVSKAPAALSFDEYLRRVSEDSNESAASNLLMSPIAHCNSER
jgi:hypothetical protein